jgi:hypothetical protein
MAFVAQCPFCNTQMRIPDQALGWSVPCPKCHDSFTAAPLPLAAATEAGPRRGPRPTAAPPTPERPFYPPALPLQPDAAPERLTTGNVLGVAALFLAAGALVLASLPVVNILTLPLAAGGLLLGLAAVLAALALGKGFVLPGAGSAASLFVLLLALVWPSLFGVHGLGHGSPDPDAGRIQAIPLFFTGTDTGSLDPDGWVDAGRAAVQQDDVRVQVIGVSVGPVEVSRDQGVSRFSAEKYLQIRLRTTNVGAARQLPYETWNAAGRGEHPPVLTDNTGTGYALKSADANWKMAEVPPQIPLSPGRFADELLVFEPPPAGVDFLHLELPGAACGGHNTYRLAIPRFLIQH